MRKAKLPKELTRDSLYFTTCQIAQMTGLSQGSIIRAIKSGRIKSNKTPGGHFRVDTDAVVRFMKEIGIRADEKPFKTMQILTAK